MKRGPIFGACGGPKFELLPNYTIIGIIRIPTPAKNPPRVKSQILEKGGGVIQN